MTPISNDGGLVASCLRDEALTGSHLTLVNASCTFLKVLEPTANARDHPRCAPSTAGKPCERVSQARRADIVKAFEHGGLVNIWKHCFVLESGDAGRAWQIHQGHRH